MTIHEDFVFISLNETIIPPYYKTHIPKCIKNVFNISTVKIGYIIRSVILIIDFRTIIWVHYDSSIL